jgi:hypothetical protein
LSRIVVAMKSVPLALILAFCACGDDATTLHDAPPIDAPPDADLFTTVLTTPALQREIDILFVIDKSPSVAANRANIVANFNRFVSTLETSLGGLPSLHVAVVSSDMGTKGSSDASPGATISGTGGCSGSGDDGAMLVNDAPVQGVFLRDVEVAPGQRERNYTGEFTDAFVEMLDLGTTGCMFEQPLHAMRRALDGHPANAGFIRPEAVLAVIFVTDEDDCSVPTPGLFTSETTTWGPLTSFRCTKAGLTCADNGATPEEMAQLGVKGQCTLRSNEHLDDIAPYRDFLVNLKGDTSKVMVSAVVGLDLPFIVEDRIPEGGTVASPAMHHSCVATTSAGMLAAEPAPRLVDFTERFTDHQIVFMCQEDLSYAIVPIAQRVQTPSAPCLTTTIPDNATCFVEDTLGSTTTRIDDECGTAPCFRVVTDTACLAGSRQRLEVMRVDRPDPATISRLRCRLD